MKEKYIVSPLQLYGSLFLIRIGNLILTGSLNGYDASIRDGLLHSVILFAGFFVFAIPAFLNAEKGMLGKTASLIYLIVFLLCCIRMITIFSLFYKSCASNGPTYGYVMILASLCACLCAVRGLEGIARSSLLICIPVVLVLVLLVFGMWDEAEVLNLSPNVFELKSIYSNLISGIANMLTLLLLPYSLRHCSKVSYKDFAIWNTISFIVEGVILVLTCAILGNLADIDAFPIYNAAVTAQVGILRRLDAIIVAILMLCSITTMSVLFFFSGNCFSKLFKLKKSLLTYFVIASFSVIGATVCLLSDQIRDIVLNKYFWCVLVLVGSVILPFTATIKRKSKARIVSLVLACAFIFPMLSGCAYVNELDERLIIKGVAIDKEEEEFSLTMLSLKTEDTEQSASIEAIKLKGESISSAIETSTLQTGKDPYLGQNLFLLLGESCELSDLTQAIKTFSGQFDSRSSVNIFYCDENAGKLIADKEPINPEELLRIADTSKKSDGFSMDVMGISSMLNDERSDIILPMLKSENDDIRLIGGMMFGSNGEKTPANNDDILGYNLLTSGIEKSELSINDNSVRIVKSDTKMSFDVDYTSPKKIGVNITINVKSNADNDDIRYMLACCENMIQKCKKANCDCIDVERYMYLYYNGLFNSLDDVKAEVLKADYNISINQE